MFINYISLMLLNLVAGLVLLASYVYFGLNTPDQKRWIPGFGVVGAIALVTGLHTVLTWPIIGSFNIAFGETTLLFGVLFLGAALALAMNWDLLTLGIYGFFAGAASLLIGLRMINLGLTRIPLLSGLGFILVGLGGIFAAPTLYFQQHRLLRLVGAIVLLSAALIFALIATLTYWGHLDDFSKWQPLPMRMPTPLPSPSR